MPPAVLGEAFAGQSVVKLVRYKERFGVSLASMVYRAEKAGILKAKQAQFLWIEFTRRGWRQNEPGTVRADRATRFERVFEEVVASNAMSRGEALRVMGVREDEMKLRLATATGDPGRKVGPTTSGEDDDSGGEPNPNVLKFPQ
jgi:hypothetical protein